MTIGVRDDSSVFASKHCAMAAQQTLDIINDVVFYLSYPKLTIGYCNRAARDFFRNVHGSTDPGNGPSSRFLSAQTRPVWEQMLASALADGTCEKRLGSTTSGRSWLVKINRIKEQGQPVGFLVCGTDITEYERTCAQLMRSETLYEALFQSMGVGAVYQDSTGAIISVNRAAQEILGRSSEEMMGLTSHASEWDAINEDGLPVPGDQHPAMVTLRTGQPVSDVYMGIARPNGERRWLIVNAVLVKSPSDQEAADVVVTFTDITEKREMRERLKHQVAQLDRALDQMLTAMSDIVEMRDPYTAGHQRQVARLAEAIAVEMGLSADQCHMIRRAGQVHDIGKMAIPAEILVKPRQLTSLELDLVKQHVEYGYRVLDVIDFAQPIAAIVRQHHERLDGSGYPFGLSGADIKLESRVVTVADVVDSIASHRPYRSALGVEAAIAELQRHAGIWYDADVVAACVRVLKSQDFVGLYDDPPQSVLAAQPQQMLSMPLLPDRTPRPASN